MKTITVLRFAVLLSAALLAVLSAQDVSGSSSACAVVRQALDDAQRIQPGVKRVDVETYFKYEGGVQFPDNARFVYAKCEYIKLEVEFEPSPSRRNAMTSPDDTVRRVSKLYIEYPVKD